MTLLQRTPRREMTRAESFWPTWLSSRPLADWPAWAIFGDDADMKVEEFTEKDHVVIRAELPGIDPERDVDITVTDHTLTIRAERRKEEKVEEKDGYRSEFVYGSFMRSMPLPMGATEDDIKATYRDGILEVRVPVGTASESRKVPISRT